MDHRDQINAFYSDLDALVDRYIAEFDLPVASLVGALEIMKQELVLAALEDDEEDAGGDEEEIEQD